MDKQINVLYVEDNNETAKVMIDLLECSPKIHFNITQVQTLKLGLEYLGRHCCNFDVILLDLMLSNSQGVNTFLSLQERCSIIPIVIVSGHEDIACECVQLGAQDYLLKGEITQGILIRSIQYSIERSNSEKKFKNLVEATGVGVYEFNFFTNRYVYVNDVLCNQSGWSRKEILEMNPIDILPEESIKKWKERREILQQGGTVEPQTEYSFYKKDGSIMWVLTVSEFIKDDNGNIVKINAVTIDITNKKIQELREQERNKKIYVSLDNKVKVWRKELQVKQTINMERLQLINAELML